MKRLWVLVFVGTFSLGAAQEEQPLQKHSYWSEPLIFMGGCIGGCFAINCAQQISQYATDARLPGSDLFFHDVNPYGVISQIVGYSALMAVMVDKVDFLELLITHPRQARMVVFRHLFDDLW